MANASGRLISKPTSAPEIAGCIRSATLAARKPIAKRLKKACKSTATDLSGCFPKTTIAASSRPNTMPHKMPKMTRFMAKLVPHCSLNHKFHELFVFRRGSLAFYAQLPYLFAVEHKLEASRAGVEIAFPIGSHGDHILVLLYALHSHPPVGTDELAVAPASDGPRTTTDVGDEARGGFDH